MQDILHSGRVKRIIQHEVIMAVNEPGRSPRERHEAKLLAVLGLETRPECNISSIETGALTGYHREYCRRFEGKSSVDSIVTLYRNC